MKQVLHLALASLVVGCAPRLSRLVEHKHYREAICAAHDGGAQRRRVVSDALAADTGAYVHVRRVELAELTALVADPALAGEVLARVDLVKISIQANTLPLDDLALDVTIKGEDMGAAAAPVGWDSLAVATGEVVPAPQRHETYATIGNLLRGIGVVATGGLSLRVTNFRKRTYLFPAPPEVYARQMPRAATLLRALGPVRCEGVGLDASADVGVRCSGHFVFDRDPAARWSLTLAQTYVAAIDADGTSACRHTRTVSVDIGSADAWSARFGPRMRALGELPGGRVTTRWEREQAPDRGR